MKVILHIGTEKTGTTSIQHFLYRNRRKLRKAGYHLLECAGELNHRALPASCLADDDPDDFFTDLGIDTPAGRAQFRASFLREFDRELRSLPQSIHSVIISSEHFHSRLRSHEAVRTLSSILEPYFDSSQVICYLREQSAACVSWYSTALKYGEVQTLDDFMQRCNPDNYYFDYRAVLANWEAAFGRESLDVRLFDKKYFVNADLLDDFEQCIQAGPPMKLKRYAFKDNESLLPAGQALMLGLNRALPRADVRKGVAKMREDCAAIIYRKLKGRGSQPPLQTRQAIYAGFSDGNENVRVRYFPAQPQLFQPPLQEAQAAIERGVVDSTRKLLLRELGRRGKGVWSKEEQSAAREIVSSSVLNLPGF